MTTVRDECLVTLRLLPDGTLRGTSREVVQPQACPLTGRWQANRVAYVLEYRVREAVGHFRYSGAVVIEEGSASVANGRKTKVQRKANASGKRRETLSGKWNNVDEGHAEGYEGGRGEFELELVRVDFTPIAIKQEKVDHDGGSPSDPVQGLQQEQRLSQSTDQDTGSSAENAIEIDDDDDAVHAFTTGEFELSGCATDAEGYEYAFDLKLQLRPDGLLFGQSKERVFQQTGSIFGKWDARRIVYRQQYVVKHEVGVYTYEAVMSRDGAVVQGNWANDEKDSAAALSEHGTFALILVQSRRQWSTSSHAHYPPRFRRSVMAILMASARTHKLPVAHWTHIFGFCSETWFTSL
ncbi:Chaperone protein DnaJ [Phytophthora cinnamomi]|nr:Chaperone protein DnaJ [Phytophthora cinnamomi]